MLLTVYMNYDACLQGDPKKYDDTSEIPLNRMKGRQRGWIFSLSLAKFWVPGEAREYRKLSLNIIGVILFVTPSITALEIWSVWAYMIES